MRIGKEELEIAVAPHRRQVTFAIDLSEGPTSLQTWGIDREGERIAGAYYVTVEKGSWTRAVRRRSKWPGAFGVKQVRR